MVRHIMVSCHHRPTFEKFIADPAFDAIMVRYNAAHPGAEREVFPHLATRRAATVEVDVMLRTGRGSAWCRALRGIQRRNSLARPGIASA